MLDISISYNRFKFLGYEFLTWLWFCIENDQDQLKTSDDDSGLIEIGNRIVLENWQNDRAEVITIKGDDAGLEEGIIAMQKGAVVTDINLCYKVDEKEWRFTLKGESLDIINLKTPVTGPVEMKEDIEGAVIEKAYLCEKIVLIIDNLYQNFIQQRISPKWDQEVRPNMKKWLLS